MSSRLYDHLLDSAEAHGITALFGIPDPAFFALFNAAAARGWTVLAPHHEAAAGFMAEGWARLTGRGAICAASLGPGFANMVPAMMHAQAEGSPVLFLAGRRGGLGAGPQKGRFQHAAQLAVAAAAVDFVGSLEDAAGVGVLGEALASLAHGPAYVELAGDVLQQICAAPMAQPAPTPLPDCAAALALIGQARAPLILAGHGIQTARAAGALAALAQRLACPIMGTPALGSLAEAIPYGFSPQTRAMIAGADLVLAIGTQLGDQVHFGQGRHWKAGDQARRWLHIDRAPTAHRPMDGALTGDLPAILPALTAALPQRPADPALAGWAEAETAHRAVQAAHACAFPASPLHPARLVVEATLAMPEDAILIRDGGALVLFQLAYGQCRPRDVLWSQNSGHLGTGLPLAIGAMLGARKDGPDRPALLLTGDSALLFHIAELESAARAHLPLVVVVGVDHQWGLEVGMTRRMLGAGTSETGTHWSREVRFDRLASGFGCDGGFVESADDLPEALAQAFATAQANRRPYVLHAAIDPQANAQDIPAIAEFASWFA